MKPITAYSVYLFFHEQVELLVYTTKKQRTLKVIDIFLWPLVWAFFVCKNKYQSKYSITFFLNQDHKKNPPPQKNLLKKSCNLICNNRNQFWILIKSLLSTEFQSPGRGGAQASQTDIQMNGRWTISGLLQNSVPTICHVL